LINSSFEDTPQSSVAPQGWEDCGFEGESKPDIQPNPQFLVVLQAMNGMNI